MILQQQQQQKVSWRACACACVVCEMFSSWFLVVLFNKCIQNVAHACIPMHASLEYTLEIQQTLFVKTLIHLIIDQIKVYMINTKV